jgi:hypothetical protein
MRDNGKGECQISSQFFQSSSFQFRLMGWDEVWEGKRVSPLRRSHKTRAASVEMTIVQGRPCRRDCPEDVAHRISPGRRIFF